jgi:hypothetical protein
MSDSKPKGAAKPDPYTRIFGDKSFGPPRPAAPGHQQQPKTTQMYPGEQQGKKKKQPKPAAGS